MKMRVTRKRTSIVYERLCEGAMEHLELEYAREDLIWDIPNLRHGHIDVELLCELLYIPRTCLCIGRKFASFN